MSAAVEADICIVGAGSGGLSVAAGAAQMGARTVLIERAAMGGDCLNSGCVPSKALIAAGRAAQAMRGAGRFGIAPVEPRVDFPAVRDHVRGVIAGIAPHDSVERFTALGVRVIRGSARFTGPDRIAVDDGTAVRAKFFVVATGSRPALPPIPGLDSVPHFTNETIFENAERPEHLAVIGGGPIGCEMAQAHRRLGSRVTLLQRGTILPKDDPELVDLVRRRLAAEGIELIEHAEIAAVAAAGGGVAIALADGRRIAASHLLVAAGRRPDTAGLGLEAAGIEADARGIRVDDRLRTSNRRVFAVGDVAGGPQFTHVAGYHAGIVIRNTLFRLPAKVDLRALPWVTYTEPELAQAGPTEAEARARHGDSVRVLRWSFAENDRARTELEAEGLVKAVVDRRGRVLGASICGPQAGELIGMWGLAIQQRLKIGAVATWLAPYPTLGEVNKRAAGSYYTPSLFSERTRRLVRLLLRLP